MIEDEFLPYFITEDIFNVSEGKQPSYDEKEVSEPQPQVAEPEIETLNTTEQVHELAIWSPQLDTAEKELLKKILESIKKDYSSVFHMQGFDSYVPQFKTLLCFGYQEELNLKAGKGLLLYEPVEIDGRTFLNAVNLKTLQEDRKQKALLWEALKKIFK